VEGFGRWVGDFIAANPALVGYVFAVYLLFRLHQVTDRQHDAAVQTNKALAAIKTFLLTKFGGRIDE
jgi:membrane carboxypeptidase/penicillin-binding protein PbpC